MTKQCVILAGGLGTRIRAQAGSLPKALLPIEGQAFVHYQLLQLRKSGIEDVVLCIGYEGQQIRDYVNDGSRWNLHVRYVDEGQELRGTGGALRLAGDQNVLHPLFFVLYGDSFLPIDFNPIWVYFYGRIEPALMTVMRNQGRWDRSNACFDGSKVTLYDKKKADSPGMEYIDYGLSLIRRDAMMTSIPSGTACDLADYFSTLSRAGQLAGYAVEQRFYEIGSPAGLEDFKAYQAAQ
jgi:NDP-sugar pyrophosphorylase family protein